MFKEKKAKIIKLEPVSITEFVTEVCEHFRNKNYISIDVGTNGTVHIFIGSPIEEDETKQEEE